MPKIFDTDPPLPEFISFEEPYGAAGNPFATNLHDMVTLVALALEASSQRGGAGVNSAIRDVSDGDTAVSTFAEGKAVLVAGDDINFEDASGPLMFDESGTVSSAYTIQQARNDE